MVSPTSTLDFYTMFEQLEAVGLQVAYAIAQSQVLKDFVYIIFVWGLFEVFFRVYKTREFLPFINFLAYFAIMLAIFLTPPSINSGSVFNYITFPVQLADGFTSGIITTVSKQGLKNSINSALTEVNQKLLTTAQSGSMAPTSSTPQQYKDEYNRIQKNLAYIGQNCHFQDPMAIIQPSKIDSQTGQNITQYVNNNNQISSVSCTQAVNGVRADIKDYVENYWSQTPNGKEIYQGSQQSSNLTGNDYDVALFMGGGNISNIAIGTLPANVTTGTTEANEGGNIGYVLRYILNYFLNSIGSLEVILLTISVGIIGPLAIYGMFMFNALFYALIICMTPIIFVLAMQKPENILMYIKWIFTVIWARSWQIIGYLLVNLFNNFQFQGGAGGQGIAGTVFGQGAILSDLWTITIMSALAVSPGIMALVLLEGRSMLTSAMTGMLGNLNGQMFLTTITNTTTSAALNKVIGGGATGGVAGGAMVGGPTNSPNSPTSSPSAGGGVKGGK